MNNIQWRSVTNSSQIKGYYYDKKTLEFYIKFLNNSVYIYKQVPSDVYYEMMSAPSLGKYFHSKIKKKYNYIKKR